MWQRPFFHLSMQSWKKNLGSWSMYHTGLWGLKMIKLGKVLWKNCEALYKYWVQWWLFSGQVQVGLCSNFEEVTSSDRKWMITLMRVKIKDKNLRTGEAYLLKPLSLEEEEFVLGVWWAVGLLCFCSDTCIDPMWWLRI